MKLINIMVMNIMKVKFFVFFLILIFLVQFSFATVLVSSTIDKASITKNEVAKLNVKIFNDSLEPLENYSVRIETSDNLVLTNNDQTIFAEIIEEIKAGAVKEITFNFKAVSTSEAIGKVFLYYGENKEFVSGTFVNIISSPILSKTNVQKVTDNSGEKIVVDFELYNYSKNRIFEVGAQVSAPQGFTVKTDGILIPYLDDNNSLKKNFEILAPIGAMGEQKVTLNYAYFDNNLPHYFEETYIVTFEDNNKFFLAGIGLIVLVIAVILYFSKSNNVQKEGIKGTGSK